MKKIFAIGALLLGSVAMFAQPQLTKDNIDEVLGAMTLEEKAHIVVGGRHLEQNKDMAGEVGHLRLEHDGPVGYGKGGSFEGFCSGGGLAQLGYMFALEAVQKGTYPAYYQNGMTVRDISAKTLAEAARAGDATAREVFRICGEYLGRGLSLLIDLLNPEIIVLGSIFANFCVGK